MAEKREVSNAVLVPGPSIAQFVIRQFLKGLEVKVEINGKVCTGHVYQLDFATGPRHDYAFANVWIKDPDNEEEHISLHVSIHTDGMVNIMPNQPEE